MKHEQSKTWKFFEKNELTHSAAHYLMTVHELRKQNGFARLSDVANHMNIKPGSCSLGLKGLKEKGLVYDDDKKMYHLTEVGEDLVAGVIKNETLFQEFFHKILGVDLWESEINACKIEHLISPNVATALEKFLEDYKK